MRYKRQSATRYFKAFLNIAKERARIPARPPCLLTVLKPLDATNERLCSVDPPIYPLMVMMKH